MSKPKDWAAILLLEAPQGVVCIRKPPRKWKVSYSQFPGGKRSRKDKNSKDTAVREIYEETGLCVNSSTIVLVGSLYEHNHHTHEPFRFDFYRATMTDEEVATRFSMSKEGEEVKLFTWTELNEMRDFSPYHRMLAEKYVVWKK